MSTKIWVAVRVPIKRLNEYLAKCNKVTLQAFFKQANWQICMMDWKKAVTLAKEPSPYWTKKLDGRTIRAYAVEMLVEKYRESSLKMEGTLFDADAGLNVWLDGRYAYIIPYGKAVLPKLEWAEDYHYQNQTDRPKHISKQQYAARCRKWDQLCLGDKVEWDTYRLQHPIVDFGPAGAYIRSQLDLEYWFGLHPGTPENNKNWKPYRRTK